MSLFKVKIDTFVLSSFLGTDYVVGGLGIVVVHGGAGVAQRLRNRWERCKNRASRPSQGTVNGGAVSK